MGLGAGLGIEVVRVNDHGFGATARDLYGEKKAPTFESRTIDAHVSEKMRVEDHEKRPDRSLTKTLLHG